MPLLSYAFSFTSLLPLSSNYNWKHNLHRNVDYLPTKLIIKRSLILFLWLNYLKHSVISESKISIVYLPTKRSLLTLAKAPMAHKKSSKEQFQFTYLKFRLNITERPTSSLPNLTSGKASTFSTVMINNLKSFDTNLIFMSSCNLKYLIRSDSTFHYKHNRFCFSRLY